MSGEETFVDSTVVTLFLGIASVIFLYWYSTKNFNFWKKRGIPYVKPVLPFFGTSYSLFRKPSHEVDLDRYRKYGPVYGQFDGDIPVLVVNDLKLIREVLVKEFPSFINRRVSYFVSGNEIIDSMMFALRGDEWKRMRSLLSPTFTTGKIKKMVNIIKECGQTMLGNFKAAVKSGKPVESNQFYRTFAMDVIASVAFSVKVDSYNDPKNKFVQQAEKAFSIYFNLKVILFQFCPNLVRFFGLQVIPKEPLFFFKEVILQIIEERKRTGQTRNDFLQLMMDTAKEVAAEEMKNENEKPKDDITTNYAQDESTDHLPKNIADRNLTLDSAVAQSVAFFIAGFDTIARVLSLMSYHLALNPQIQNRVFEEVREVLQKTEGELTYEALQEMKYLDNVLSETLRLYPVIPRLERMTEEDCKLGDSGITVPKGVYVLIPVYSLHKDPNLFPDPEKFDPDRFTAEERAKRDPYAYLPFGAGPRFCFGMRFALMQMKLSFCLVIANYRIHRCPETKVPLDFHLGGILIIPKKITLQFEERKDKIPLK